MTATAARRASEPNPARQYRNVHVELPGRVSWAHADGTPASGTFPLLIIRIAWYAGLDLEDEADGFGPGMGTRGDWSAIRDSSDAATDRMLEKSLNFIARLARPNPERGEYRDERLADPQRFDPRSFRTVTLDDGHQVTVGCPLGHWHPRARAGYQCDVPMEAQRVRHPVAERNCPNPLLALVNPAGRRGEQLGTAVYDITYQHARDGASAPPRKHVFTSPEGVSLWVQNDYQVLIQATGQSLVGWFTATGRRVR